MQKKELENVTGRERIDVQTAKKLCALWNKNSRIAGKS
jgi:hypothetical protein